MAYTHPGRSTWFAGAAPPRLVPPLTREHPHQRCHARGHPRHGRVSLTCVATPRPRPGGFPRVGGVDRTAELNDGGGWADLGLLRNRRPDGSGLASRGAGIRHQCASQASKLRDSHRILWLGHQVPYTHYLPWPGGQPGRPSWPWKCAHVRSTAMPRGRVRVLRGGIGGNLKCDFFVLSVPAAVGHCFMSILTHPNR